MKSFSHVSLCFVIVCSAACGPFLGACSSSKLSQSSSDAGNGSEAAVEIDSGGSGSIPVPNISGDLMSAFTAGEAAFDLEFQPSEGLGPLYTRGGCVDCHTSAARGPGAATKMAVVEADGMTALPDQSLLAFGDTEHPNLVSEIPGVHTPILAPTGFLDAGIGEGSVSVRVTMRIGPPIFGRGYMEAIEDSEIERMESQQATRTDGIHGHVNHLTFVSQPNPDQSYDTNQTGQTVIGRFGLKARIATIDEFAADALQLDMGITSPMRPAEFANPDGVTDDLKPGVDVTADEMNSRAMYIRLLAIPERNEAAQNGRAWFEQCNCQVCHAESLHTRSDYPIPQLANIDAPVYTDMLLHDMGDDLADSIAGGNEGQAGPRDWRTAPLIGMRYSTTFLHDGRAKSINDAILEHAGNGSEASLAVTCYQNLGVFQENVLDFVGSL